MVGGVGPQRTHSQPTFVQVRRPLAIVIAKGLVIKENRHTTINALSLKVSQTITSKTKVLQMPSAINVNPGGGGLK